MMNDWLDYKGSGSARVYAANDQVIAHAAKNKIKNTIYGVMDKITNADEKRELADYRQKEADRRYEEARKEANVKALHDRCHKLCMNLSGVYDKSREYSKKIDEIYALYDNRKNARPNALSSIDSAIRSLTNDVRRIRSSISTELRSCASEYRDLANVYDQLSNNGYIVSNQTKPWLDDAKNYLEKIKDNINRQIAYSSVENW